MADDVKKTENVTASAATQSSDKSSGSPRAISGTRDDSKGIAPKKFEKVANTARSFNGGRQRRDRRDRRTDRKEEPKQYEEQTIAIDRVARVVKGGRRFRFKALVVVGDRKAKVGVGVSKGQDVQAAVQKATDVAKKNMITVPIVNSTIPHEIEVKVTGAHVLLKPAAPGTGIIAGGVVRSIIGVTGISNLLSKSLGSTNKVNIAYATIKALENLVPKDQWVGAKPKSTVAASAAKQSSPEKLDRHADKSARDDQEGGK
jgi:small subunit ribosomal protein S5